MYFNPHYLLHLGVKKISMKKALIIIGISILALILIIAFGISPIAESYIEKNSKELIGRKAEMGDLSVNLFSGRLKIEDFTLYENNDTTPFVSFNFLDVNLNMLGLLGHKVEIEHVLLSHADITVIQNGDIFNFSDIIDFFSDTTATTDTIEEPSSWAVIINDIHLDHSFLCYKDKEIGSEWNLKDISIIIPGIDLSDLQADMGLHLDFLNGGQLATNIKYDTDKSLYDLQLHIKNFQLSPILPYLQQSLNVENVTGTFSSDLAIKGSTEHVMNLDVNGDIRVKDFCLVDSLHKNVAAFDSVYTSIRHIDLINNKIELNKLHVLGFKSYYELFQDTTDNFTLLIKADTTAAQDSATEVAQTDTIPEQPFALIIDDLQINNSEFLYTDNTLPQQFNYTISDIQVSAQKFNLNEKNDVTLTALLQNSGKLKIKWIGSIDDISNQNITVTVNNLDLQSFSPYSVAMFGNPITNGKISLQSQNIIINNNLRGTNKLNIFKPEIGDKDKSVSAEYKTVPLKMGVYVLTDKNGKADLDLPVSGNIDSPNFSYGKLIIKTLGNLLVKVAASPFNALKSGKENIEQVLISASSSEFNDEQYAQFAQIGALQKEKPKLKLILVQDVLYKPAIEEYCMVELKKNMAIQDENNPTNEQNANDLLIKEKYTAISSKAPELTAFADKLMQENGIKNKSKYTNEQKAVLLYETKMKEVLLKDMNWRNTLLHSYLTRQCSVADSVLSISSNLIESDTVKQFKDRYRIEWKLDE